LERPPKQVRAVAQQLQALVKAYASGLFPHQRLEWTNAPHKRGRKGGLQNPHPTGEPWTEWVEPAVITSSFRELQALFKRKLTHVRRPPGPTKTAAKAWYRQLAHEVLAESSIWWSDRKEYTFVDRPVSTPPASYTCHAGSSAPPQPEDSDLWLDTAVTPYVLKKYEAASAIWHTFIPINAPDVAKALALVDSLYQPIRWDYEEQWTPLDLDAALDQMLAGRTHREGRPTYLAYAVLGALLGVTPEKVREKVDSDRRSHRRGQPR
jgi:hypothetical protein